jgi:small subunit ribosomal protein S16
MAVTIRLARHGSTHSPFYHVVAIDRKSARDGKVIEKLGYYDPSREPSLVEIKEDRVRYWHQHGARPSNCVAKLLKVKKIDLQKPTAEAGS